MRYCVEVTLEHATTPHRSNLAHAVKQHIVEELPVNAHAVSLNLIF